MSIIQLIKRNSIAVGFSLLVHAMLLVLLVSSFDWAEKPEQLQNKPNIVNAVAVDASKVDAELKKLQRADTARKQKEQDRIATLKRQEQAAKKQRIAEEKRLAQAKQKRITEEKKRKAAEQKRQLAESKRKLEQKKLEAAKAEQQKLEAKRKAEKKRLAKLAADKKAAEKKAAEKKRQAELERKRKLAAQQRKEKERKQALAKQLAAEETARANEIAKTEIQKSLLLIQQKVTRKWLKPNGSVKGLACKVRVRIIPGGDVVSVQVVKGSGNSIFDRSVERAVRKASPLPLPSDPAIAARMREIDFNFAPEA